MLLLLILLSEQREPCHLMITSNKWERQESAGNAFLGQLSVRLSWLSGESTQILMLPKVCCPHSAPHGSCRIRDVRKNALASFL